MKSESSGDAMLMSRDVDGAVAEVTAATKIRKRCARSSSDASSEPRRTKNRRRLRLKRSVQLIGRTGGGVSTCNTSSSRRMSESSRNRHQHRRLASAETRPTSASSPRKLVSALWQLDKGAGGCEEGGEVGWDAAVSRRSSDHHRRSASMELSRLSRRKSKALERDGERSWHNGHAQGHWLSDVMGNGVTVEAHAYPHGLASPCPGDRMAQLQELYNSMTASKELVRVLANVLAPSALTPTAASLLAALRSELDVVRARARQLAKVQKCHGGDEASAEQLRERLAEEMRAWKSRHREKAAAAARLMASELDAERRSRQRAERVGKKLGEALAEAEASLREARRELDRERNSRERLEKVCDELANGDSGAADDDEVEELRREAESARQELEREREMLQLADKLREERVRMKLAEARLQFEEKNAVVDCLRQELEAFLGRDKEGQESPAHGEQRNAAGDHRLQLVLASESIVNGIDRVAIHMNGEGRGENDGEVGDDSDGSDIELNMNANSRDYSWCYSTSSNKEPTARKAASQSSRHDSFSDRGTEGGAGPFDRRFQGLGEGLEQHYNEGCSDDDGTTTKDMDEDAERYEAIKNLREQMLAGHGFVFLPQQSGEDADRDHHRITGFVCQVEEGGLW